MLDHMTHTHTHSLILQMTYVCMSAKCRTIVVLISISTLVESVSSLCRSKVFVCAARLVFSLTKSHTSLSQMFFFPFLFCLFLHLFCKNRPHHRSAPWGRRGGGGEKRERERGRGGERGYGKGVCVGGGVHNDMLIENKAPYLTLYLGWILVHRRRHHSPPHPPTPFPFFPLLFVENLFGRILKIALWRVRSCWGMQLRPSSSLCGRKLCKRAPLSTSAVWLGS